MKYTPFARFEGEPWIEFNNSSWSRHGGPRSSHGCCPGLLKGVVSPRRKLAQKPSTLTSGNIDYLRAFNMEMPDIPDDRPHKPASLLTSPTIVLDDCGPEYPESQYNSDKPSESDKLTGEHMPEQW